MECYSAIKGTKCASGEMWIDLERVLQSEVRREKQMSYLNMYMWNIENGADESICKVQTETENGHADTKGGCVGMGWIGRLGMTCIHCSAWDR